MALIIEKYGGTSLESAALVRRAAARTAAARKAGHRLVVVVSAPGRTTDRLLGRACEQAEEAEAAALDLLLASGEQISAALLTLALEEMGVPARAFCGWQAGIHTKGPHGRAHIGRIDTRALRECLAAGQVAVVAGFQGVGPDGEVTTIGRGGSDTTAVALAAALGADLCRIYTDVSGVYTADPRVVPEARRHRALGYDETIELARLGARVLHDRAAVLAKQYQVPVEIRSSMTEEAGTMIGKESLEKNTVAGAALSAPTLQVRLEDGGARRGRHRLFAVLAGRGVNIETIAWGEALIFTAHEADRAAVEETLALFYPGMYEITPGQRRLSIVGSGLTAGCTAGMLECLEAAGVPVYGLSDSGTALSVWIDGGDAERGLQAVHGRFLSPAAGEGK